MNLTKPQKLLERGSYKEAAALLPELEHAPAHQDPRTEILRARISAALMQETSAAALADTAILPPPGDILSAAAARFPDHAPTHLFLGISAWDDGHVTAAAAAFERVLQLQPRNDLARSYGALCRLALDDQLGAAEAWRRFGFSDNVMFRVRLAEFVESAWLRDGTFMSESALARSEPSSGGAAPRRYHARRALNRFYARDFRGLLRYVSPPPVSDELEIFLAATAHEMLGQYEAARSYLEAIRPRRAEWPEALIALGARLDMRAGKIASAARDFASIVVVGPEDFGVNYCMGVVCLAYERRELARSYFLRAFTSYMVDTLDFQWAQLTTAVLEGSRSAA